MLDDALAHDNVRLLSGATVTRMHTDANGKAIVALDVDHRGEPLSVKPKWVVLSAGAVNSAALLLRSADDKLPAGIANRSGMVGRNFMTHHSTAMMSVDPRTRNDAVYQKTIASNDYYFDDGEGGPPLGHIQAIGKISAPMLRSFGTKAPYFFLRWPERTLRGLVPHQRRPAATREPPAGGGFRPRRLRYPPAQLAGPPAPGRPHEAAPARRRLPPGIHPALRLELTPPTSAAPCAWGTTLPTLPSTPGAAAMTIPTSG